MVTKELLEKRELLTKLITELERDVSCAPSGSLRIAMVGDRATFYQVTEKNDTKGRYLHKTEAIVVKRLAQKGYDLKLLRTAEDTLNSINRFLKSYSETALADIYDKLPVQRQTLVQPHLISDNRYAQEWLSTPYQRKEFWNGDIFFATLGGEQVRSKSEVLIANALFHANIPYKYECPVNVDGKIVFPDFTILKKKTREVVYWEHFGMMDSEGYRDDFYLKISQYSKNGIIPGGNLYMTFEERSSPLNIHNIDGIIRHILKSDS